MTSDRSFVIFAIIAWFALIAYHLGRAGGPIRACVAERQEAP